MTELSIEPLGGTAYLAPEGYEGELRAELGKGVTSLFEGGRLFFVRGAARSPAWAANVWVDPVRIRFESIAQAATALRSLGHDWVSLRTPQYRRADSIAANLPKVVREPLVFPALPPDTPLGSWALVDTHEIVASAKCTSLFPNGEARFVEDHTQPPSRAYLKIWEALTIARTRPRPGARCIDLGSSPGGWTWALEKIGARVMSVDKAPIAPKLLKLTRVKYVQESAFALDPKKVGKVDWLCSDVICYPARIVKLIERWIAVHPNANFVITIKLQGESDLTPLRDLEGIEGARLLHLHHNRHELTWLRIAPETIEQGGGETGSF